MTPPMQVAYADILQVWQEADAIPQIEHAWLFDHLVSIGGDADGPIFEGWTLLSALAAQTERLRLGLLVTSNRIRPPALLAKIAATVDIVSGGRLDLGIGVGSRPDHPLARREYAAHGLPYHDTAHALGSLDEACTVIRRLWTEEEPFDFSGSYLDLKGARCNPKPVQRPCPPILIGGRSAATLRIVARHADIWNIPGSDLTDAVSRSTLLDRYCAEIGRDPASITRSIVLPVSYHQPGTTRDAIDHALAAGFTHIVLGLPAPYPAHVAQWIAEEIITTRARTQTPAMGSTPPAATCTSDPESLTQCLGAHPAVTALDQDGRPGDDRLPEHHHGARPQPPAPLPAEGHSRSRWATGPTHVQNRSKGWFCDVGLDTSWGYRDDAGGPSGPSLKQLQHLECQHADDASR